MPLRPCLTCGTLSPNSRCPTHSAGASWNGARNRNTQARFRDAVLQRDGHRCTYTTNGERCNATTSLQAHHTQPGNNDPETGITLCDLHHRVVDPHAR